MAAQNYISRSLKLTFCLANAFILSACSMLSPVKSEVQNTYVIKSVPHVSARSKSSKTILVTTPDASSIYNTTQMAYSTRPFQVAYFAKNQWAESPTKMMQGLMMQTLQNTHHYKAVVNQSYTGRYDYVLNSQLIELQQDFTHQPAILRLSMRMNLINSATGQAVASKGFNVQTHLRDNSPLAGVYAANRASEALLRQMVRFCLRSS